MRHRISLPSTAEYTFTSPVVRPATQRRSPAACTMYFGAQDHGVAGAEGEEGAGADAELEEEEEDEEVEMERM